MKGYVSKRPEKTRVAIPGTFSATLFLFWFNTEPELPPPQVVPEGKLNDKELQVKVNEIVIRNLQ